MAHPYQQERYTDPNPRLRQLAATRQAGREVRAGTQIWHSSQYRVWISVTRDSAGYVLSYHAKCPCASS